MASNPPFLVEDQTDENFFDNLVNDDDDKTGLAVRKLTESNDSDDASAFANLTIREDSASKTDNFDGKEKDPVPAPANRHTSDGGYNNSLGFDNSLTDSNDRGEEGARSEVGLDRGLSKNSGSVNSGVKEVGWNSFYADSNENGVHGTGSYSDFFNDFGENSTQDFPGKADVKTNQPVLDQNSVSSYGQYHEGGQVDEASTTDNGNVQDLNSSQYWENMYPGWKYDQNTGQWYQDDGYLGNLQSSYDSSGGDCNGVTDVKADVSYLQQAVESVAGTMKAAVNGATEGVTNCNQLSQVNNGYPENMIFDPQYPGWYYDTIAQEWRALESYNASSQSTILSTDQVHDQQNQNGVVSTIGNSQINSSSVYSEYGQGYNYCSQGLGSPSEHGNCGESYGNYGSQGVNMWQPGTAAKTEEVSQKQQLDTSYGSNMFVNNHVNHLKSTCSSPQEVQLLNNVNQFQAEANGVVGLRSFIHSENLNHQFNQTSLKQNEQIHFSNDFNGSQKYVNVAHQPLQESQQFSYASNTGRSSAVRRPHALVTFGFGGKLIVMKNSMPQSSSFSSQESLGASISVLNLMEVVDVSTNGSGAGLVACDYFRTLCQQSFSGPLVGGNVGSKELNKWIDDKIANCVSPDKDYGKGEVLRLLISLLKISCQYYGKLRSPFGADTVLKETDTPESSIAKLFVSAKKNDKTYGALSHCLQQLPSEGQVRAIATEVQNLLVSGQKKEALQCAQEGQLWGPALVLASQFGDQFFVDTVKQMALRHLIAGSPLRTLCLLIAGQPAEVFSAGTTINSMNMSQQHAQLGANCMLDDWEENLAVITANRTKDDELVIIHLGDCLWRERNEVTAAHICYLVAEANFEPYSDSARLCLIGADHWNFPRTYASPEAIQRTELYEYSKVTGNSQFILMPFQPYKLIYAHMLAEVGKLSESLKYCQAVLKSLKPNRTAEVETWKQAVLSLEDRIRIHQQGGYAANLAPAKLVGKLLNFFDSTAHRVVGGPPPIAPSESNGNFQGNDPLLQQTGSRVSSSQSAMAISSLMSSTSMEPISDWVADGKMTVQNRSVSEPDFGRTPRQVDSSKEAGASTAQGKASGSVGASRFARFGFGSQLLQKTVGLVLRPRADKQAKLGDKNKFYYDEKLKRWVEEGAELPAEEAALPPPPTTASFQNGTSGYNLKSALETEGSPTNMSPKFRNPTPIEHASGIPPIPTSSNQFSACGRMGVRARYVDTFNRGGGDQANLFQSPAVPSLKPAMATNAKFFIPTPVSTSEQSMESVSGSGQEENTTNHPTTSDAHESLISSIPSQSINNMQRFPSMDSLGQKGNMSNANGEAHSRRTASWSGQNFADALSPPGKSEIRPLGKMLGMPQSSFIPSPSNGSFGDELHEVEL